MSLLEATFRPSCACTVHTSFIACSCSCKQGSRYLTRLTNRESGCYKRGSG